MNRATKGWETRYDTEIKIIEEQLKELRDRLYTDFMSFIEKTGRYQALDKRLQEMQYKQKKFHRKHKGDTIKE